jgi:hypothetical protein
VFAQHSSLPWSPSASVQQLSSEDSGSNTAGWTILTTAASTPLPMAPQVKVINQQQQQPTAPSPMTLTNSTAGQNGTFAATAPVVASGKLMYLGYHGGVSSPNDKSSSDSKQPSTHRSSSTSTSDDDSTGKKKTSSTKLDRADSVREDSSPRKDKSSSSKPSGSTSDGSESLSLLPDFESPSKNKVDSAIKNTISSIKDNTPFLLPFP